MIKTERTQIHSLSDVLAGVLVAIASLDLKVPNFSEKVVVTRTNYQMFKVLPFGRTNTQVLKRLSNEGTPLPCKWLDLRVALITT